MFLYVNIEKFMKAAQNQMGSPLLVVQQQANTQLASKSNILRHITESTSYKWPVQKEWIVFFLNPCLSLFFTLILLLKQIIKSYFSY